MTDTALLAQSALASSLLNMGCERFRDAPRDTRQGEGWTEAWGGKPAVESNDAACWTLDVTAVSDMLATQHPQEALRLVQYRPAWLEQLVLRMAKVPFVVINSPYLCTEATGPLPYLQDLRTDGGSKADINATSNANSSPSETPPVAVGRSHPQPASSFSNQNSILEYLKQHRKIDLDASIKDDPNKVAKSTLITNLVQNDLQRILVYLRYEDADAWDQVYRPQCYDASCPASATRPSIAASWFRPSKLGGMFQAWCERSTARHSIKSATRGWTVPVALDKAKVAYAALESQLASDPGRTQFMLGGSQPTLVDAILWDHLAQALCDVHLVILLSSYPRLVKYFQTIHEKYFNTASKDQEWNATQNKLNPFQQLPIGDRYKRRSQSSDEAKYKDAIALMQELSLHQHDLQEILNLAKASRDEIRDPPTKSLLYRWRMGEDLEKRKATPPTESNPMRMKLLRDQKRNDQVWMSGVMGISVLAVLLLQKGSG